MMSIENMNNKKNLCSEAYLVDLLVIKHYYVSVMKSNATGPKSSIVL